MEVRLLFIAAAKVPPGHQRLNVLHLDAAAGGAVTRVTHELFGRPLAYARRERP